MIKDSFRLFGYAPRTNLQHWANLYGAGRAGSSADFYFLGDKTIIVSHKYPPVR
jgi:hypothetical protein